MIKSRLLYISIFLWLLMVSVQAAPPIAGPVEGADYENQSVATASGVTAGVFNPAGLGYFSSMGIHYAHTFTDSGYKGDDGVLISSQAGFFSIEWLNHGDDVFRRKYTIGAGDRIFPNFYIGGAYSWFGGSNLFYKGKKDWKLGLLYHPRPFASLGFVVDRLNEPRFGGVKFKRLYQPGVAIRPFGDKLTFSVDGRWTEGEDLSTLQGNFRFAAGPYHGISFVSDYRSEGQWRFGLSFDFNQTRVGAQGNLDNHQSYSGGAYFMEMSMTRYGAVMESRNHTGILKLDGDIVEEPRQRPFFGDPRRSLYSVISAIRRAADDPRIDQLAVKIEGIGLNFASAQELRVAFEQFRNSGKKITVFMMQGGNLQYYLASAADEIYMDPTGLLELKGLAATATFYKGAMDKLGIKAQVIKTGPHKTFADAFTETGLTPDAREQIDWLLDDLYQQLVDGVSSGRRMLPERVKALIDAGPYTTQDAYQVGLIDGLKHYDEIVDNNKSGARSRNIDLLRYYKTDDINRRWSEPKHVAIVYADGSILPGRSGRSFLEGRTIGSKTLAGALKHIRENSRVKAVVLRVNSPGGDVFASEEIYRQLELLKGKKPLVVSMGGVAASGGYYIACPGDEILASPGTITGSIGVIMGKPDLSGFYDKIGINHETIRRGAHADIRSTDRPATDEEMALIEKMIWQYYGDFVSKVSTWRKLDYDSVDAIGQGRVWTGHQARQRGLVDNYGGIWEAVEEARLKAEIDPEDKVIVDIYPSYGFTLLPEIGLSGLQAQFDEVRERSTQSNVYYKSAYDLDIK